MVCYEIVVHDTNFDIIRDYARHLKLSLNIVYDINRYFVLEITGDLKPVKELAKYNRML